MRRPLLWFLALALVGGLLVVWRSLDAPKETAVVAPARVEASSTARSALELTDVPAEVERAPHAEPASVVEIQSTERAGLEVRGRVLTSDARPLADVEIALTHVFVRTAEAPSLRLGKSDEPVARTRTTADGAWRIPIAIPPEGPIVKVELTVARSGFATRERALDVAATDRTVDLGDVTLFGTTTLRGFVNDRDGVPIADARVVARAGSLADSSTSTVRSLANGAFTIPDGPCGQVELRASLADGRNSAAIPLLGLEPGSVRDGIELVLPGYLDPNAVSGVVLDVDGTPLPGAMVSATVRKADGGGSGFGGRPTDARGRFRIQGFPGSTVDITAGSAHLENVAVGRHDLVLQFQPLRLVNLHVRGAHGPIEYFAYRVRTTSGNFTKIETDAGLSVRTSGEDSIPVPTIPFTIEVRAPGYVSAEIGPFDPASLPDLLDAVLTALPALRGIVVRGDAPVAGATVRAQAAVARDVSVHRKGFDLPAQPCEGCPGTRTDTDGSFTLDTGADGTWYVRVEAGEERSALVGPIELTRDRAPTELRIDLAPRGAIEGRVRSADGAGLANRKVRASCGDGDPLTTTTTADGAYRFDRLAPGDWQVHLADPALEENGALETHYARQNASAIAWDCRVSAGTATRFDILVAETARVIVRIHASVDAFADVAWTVSANRVETTPTAAPIAGRAGEKAGEYVLDLPAGGEWRIGANGVVGDVQLGLGRTVNVGGAVDEVAFSVTGGAVHGRINPDIPADARVQLAGRLGDGTQILATAGVADDGVFVFPFGIAGRYGLMLVDHRDRRTIVTVAAGETVDAGAF